MTYIANDIGKNKYGVDMARERTVVCCGETMALLIAEGGGDIVSSTTFGLGYAGAEANVAAWLALLGVASAWSGVLGADPLGDRILRGLESAGVDTGLVRRDPVHPTGLMYKNSLDGSTVVHYLRRESAGAHYGPTDGNLTLQSRPSLIHLSGVTPALSEACDRAVDHIVEAHSPSTQVSFDVNFRPRLWNDPATAGRVLLGYAGRSDIVFVGLDEAKALWGVQCVEDVRDLLPQPTHIVVKDGANDATYMDRGGRSWRAPAIPTPVIEVVGAGDAFAAGWLCGYLQDLDPDSRLRLGHLTAASALASAHDVSELAVPAPELVEAALYARDPSATVIP